MRRTACHGRGRRGYSLLIAHGGTRRTHARGHEQRAGGQGRAKAADIERRTHKPVRSIVYGEARHRRVLFGRGTGDYADVGEVGLDKRNPAYFHHVRQALGTEPAETWVFEDAVHAAATAYNAGFPVAGVPDPYSDQEELKKVCHLYLPGLTDFDGFWRLAEEIGQGQGEEEP